MLTAMVWVGAALVTAAVVRFGRIKVSEPWDRGDYWSTYALLVLPSVLAVLATLWLNGG